MMLIDHVKEAAKARSDLYVFASVVGALENGTVRPPAQTGAQRIIKIAKSEQAKALARFDKHILAIKDGWEQ
jgi:hypothetical protein